VNKDEKKAYRRGLSVAITDVADFMSREGAKDESAERIELAREIFDLLNVRLEHAPK
jgi:hypothetical protein